MNEFENIYNTAKKLSKLYEIQYEYAKTMVIYIIKNRITIPSVIESCLDETLNIPTDKGYELHSILCGYYSVINREIAEFYMNEYHQLWGEDEEWKDIKK